MSLIKAKLLIFLFAL